MIRRGVVIVHGVGEQRRADQLDTVVEPLVAFLGRSVGHQNVHLVARTHRDGSAIANATIRLMPPGAEEPVEEWHIREAWWAECFRPTDSATVLGWAVRAFWAVLVATFQHVFLRNVRRVLAPITRNRPKQQGTGVWQVPVAASIYHLLDALAWVVITLAFLLVFLLGVVLIVPLYIFLLLPVRLIWPSGVGEIQRKVVNLFTFGIGDQYAMTNRRVALAAAANVVTEALRPFLDPELPVRRAYDTVTIIAHSGGSVVSYEALASERVTGWLDTPPADHRVTLVTCGNGLNLAWKMRAKRKDADRAFWNRRIDRHVNWIDIYARYDPVPQGEAPPELVEALLGPAPHPYVSIRVANTDLPTKDHGGYWANREESMARIVHAISDSRLGYRRLDPNDGSYASNMFAGGVRRAVEAGRERRGRVSRAVTLRLSLAVAAVVALITRQDSLSRVGERMIGSRVPGRALWLDISAWRDWLTAAIALAIIGLVVALIARLITELVSWNRADHDEPLPAEMESRPVGGNAATPDGGNRVETPARSEMPV